MSVALEIVGLEALKAALRAMPAELRESARPLVQQHAEQAAAALRQGYGEYRGILRSRVRVSADSSSQWGASTRVISAAPHALIYERGTAARRTRRGASRGVMPKRPIFGAVLSEARARLWGALRDLLVSHGLAGS